MSASGTNPQDESAAIAIAQGTVDRFTGWVQFADAKAAGVLVLLGLGLSDMLDRAGKLANAHKLESRWGDLATFSLYAALALAIVAVVIVSTALFPRLKAAVSSPFYFGSVAKLKDGKAYVDELKALDDSATLDGFANQGWQLAVIAKRKFDRVRISYWVVLAFLVFWASARLALSFAA